MKENQDLLVDIVVAVGPLFVLPPLIHPGKVTLSVPGIEDGEHPHELFSTHVDLVRGVAERILAHRSCRILASAGDSQQAQTLLKACAALSDLVDHGLHFFRADLVAYGRSWRNYVDDWDASHPEHRLCPTFSDISDEIDDDNGLLVSELVFEVSGHSYTKSSE